MWRWIFLVCVFVSLVLNVFYTYFDKIKKTDLIKVLYDKKQAIFMPFCMAVTGNQVLTMNRINKKILKDWADRIIVTVMCQ